MKGIKKLRPAMMLGLILILALILSVCAVLVNGLTRTSVFNDVPEDAWYRDAVEYTAENGYFQGTAENTFSPEDFMTRAMFITVLGRLEKNQAGTYPKPDFSDTAQETWYTPYLGWAVKNGLVTGYPDGSFRPDTVINHEQMSVILARYASYRGVDLAERSAVSSAAFTDENDISGWAKENVHLVAACGIFSGYQDGSFLSFVNTDRAEAAFAIMRLDMVCNGKQLSEFKIPEIPKFSKTDKLMAQMSLYEKVYQMLVVSPEKLTGSGAVTQVGAAMENALAQYPVGGILYNTANLISASQTVQMISDTKAYSAITPFITVDEEGGKVARVASKLGTTKFSPMYTYRNQGADKAYEIGAALAKDISQFGFNQDYAPVADIWTNPANTVIGTRAFGDDPNTVAALVAAVVKGLQDNGVIATLKHFPGHGDTAEDSHTSVAYSYKTLDQLRSAEFIPFRAGIEAGADFVMCAHVTVPNVDSVPATMSEILITDILRGELGFEGVVVTDSMSMKAISAYYSSAEAAVNAVKAGCDMILSPYNMPQAAYAMMQAVENGTISEARIDESVRRILSVKEKYGLLK